MWKLQDAEFLLGLQNGFTKFLFFLCLPDSTALVQSTMAELNGFQEKNLTAGKSLGVTNFFQSKVKLPRSFVHKSENFKEI